MKDYRDEIYKLIPQRPPFLFVDSIIERDELMITTSLTLTGMEDFFKGHFPGNPIMPGVLLQEALFQTAALLMGGRAKESQSFGVVTKVSNARFKAMARPGDELVMHVEQVEQVGNAFYFKGRTQVKGKTIAAVDFTCALVSKK
jgi:3-hydroxyacyl-[acyl-carrier-protein] dehydratase